MSPLSPSQRPVLILQIGESEPLILGPSHHFWVSVPGDRYGLLALTASNCTP